MAAETPEGDDGLGGSTVLGLSDTTPANAETSGRLSLLIIGDHLINTVSLPPTGRVRLGRGPANDITIDDASISRVHAELSIGPPLTIKDLGSANGTKVHDRTLASDVAEPIKPGDVLQLGNATLIVQQRAPATRVHRVWNHEYFEARLHEETERCTRINGSFSIARFHCEPRLPDALLQDVLSTSGRTSDTVSRYSDKELEFLLLGVGPDELDSVIARISSELRNHVRVHSGVASFPRDGRSVDELVLHASPFPRHSNAEAAITAAINADRRMHDLHALSERIAAGNITVLILGETGVGKEVLAERIHRTSPRNGKPYLKLNCAALTETLLESELFGHERGAFTGAVSTKAGLLETADGGTIFLDEIGELPLSMQVKLLRVLEDRVVTRVGGLKSKAIDVRFITATNRDLDDEVERGRFRQDFYFRINGATLVIPPLRERRSEISDLARVFIAHGAKQVGVEAPSLSSEGLALLLHYSWPGNIRELRNVMERAVLLSAGAPIGPDHLPLERMRATLPITAKSVAVPSSPVNEAPKEPLSSSELEDRERVMEALAAADGNQSQAAQSLGIARRTLINKLERYGISGPRKKRGG